jgi:Flp pilus assembly protein TadB
MVEAKYVLGSLAVAAVGYAVFFDYQRRNNPEFRKKLANQRREAQKLKQKKQDIQTVDKIDLPEKPIPTTNEGREQYFMQNLQLGEQLMQQGFLKLIKVLPLLMQLQLVSTELFKFIRNHRNC